MKFKLKFPSKAKSRSGSKEKGPATKRLEERLKSLDDGSITPRAGDQYGSATEALQPQRERFRSKEEPSKTNNAAQDAQATVGKAWSEGYANAGSEALSVVDPIRPPDVTSERLTAIINTLQALAETLPGVVAAASQSVGRRECPWRTTGTLEQAIRVLEQLRRERRSQEHSRETELSEATEKDAIQHGIALGIKQEKNRVKEARRGRNAKH